MLTSVPGTGGTGTPFRLIALVVVNRVGSLALCVKQPVVVAVTSGSVIVCVQAAIELAGRATVPSPAPARHAMMATARRLHLNIHCTPSSVGGTPTPQSARTLFGARHRCQVAVGLVVQGWR